MKRSSSLLPSLLASMFLASCSCGAPAVPPGEGEGEGEQGPDMNACVPLDEGPEFAISSKADLRWKRSTQLQIDLILALGLDFNAVCSEVGLRGACFTLIHQVPLGGLDPVNQGIYKPIAEPGSTMPLSTDRVVLSACGIRADAESLNATEKIVWRNIDFAAASLDPDDPAIADDVTELYHRLLARDPTNEELAIVAQLADDVSGVPVPPRDFAKLACYAVATTSEFLFQ